MSLRDYFAAHMPMDQSGMDEEVAELLAGAKPEDLKGQVEWACRARAKLMYCYADAVLLARREVPHV